MVTLTFKDWWIKKSFVPNECNCYIEEYFERMCQIKDEEYFKAVKGYKKYENQIRLETYN